MHVSCRVGGFYPAVLCQESARASIRADSTTQLMLLQQGLPCTSCPSSTGSSPQPAGFARVIKRLPRDAVEPATEACRDGLCSRQHRLTMGHDLFIVSTGAEVETGIRCIGHGTAVRTDIDKRINGFIF